MDMTKKIVGKILGGKRTRRMITPTYEHNVEWYKREINKLLDKSDKTGDDNYLVQAYKLYDKSCVDMYDGDSDKVLKVFLRNKKTIAFIDSIEGGTSWRLLK